MYGRAGRRLAAFSSRSGRWSLVPAFDSHDEGCWGAVQTFLRMQYECEDILGNGALFSLGGAGLGESEVYRIALAARRLGEDPQQGVAALRFFGKFFGRASDYYVFEATLREPPAPTGEAAGEILVQLWMHYLVF